MATVYRFNRGSKSTTSGGSTAEQRDTALQRASRASQKLNEMRKTAPGRVLTYGAAGTVAAGVIDKKIGMLGGKVPASAAASAVVALYALSEDDMDAAAVALGLAAPTLYGVGEQLADWMPF